MLKQTMKACPVCASQGAREHVRFDELVFSECTGCGTLYRSEEDPAAFRAASYDGEYFTGEKSAGYDRDFERRVRRANREIVRALAACADSQTPGAVLDIGCSLGYALEAARRLGREATGIDVSEFAVGECRRRGYSARVGRIDATGLPEGSFRVALLKHVLEHSAEPRRSLLEIARVLAPGGAVFISTPNARYWKARRRPGSYKFFRPDGLGRQHYLYFTEGSLRRLLEESGFAEGRLGGGLVEALFALAPGLRKEIIAVARRAQPPVSPEPPAAPPSPPAPGGDS